MLYITIDERGNMGLAARQFEIDAVTLPVGNCDDDRFKRLVDEHRDAIVRYFFRRLPRAVVIDAVADTFALVREQMPWKARESDELLRLYSVAYAVARERTAAPIACPACGTAVDVVEHGNRTHSFSTRRQTAEPAISPPSRKLSAL
jgi:hypothetical protein